METQATFEAFGSMHLITVAALVLAGALILYGSRRWATREQAQSIGIAIAVFMLVQELFDRGLHVYLGDDFWNHVLPLQMCGASLFLTIVLLISRSRSLFQLLYFWGLGGGTVALLTPDTLYVFPHPLYITFFTSHALIIVGVAYVMVNFGYRPTLRSLAATCAFTLVYVLAMFPVNALLGTNYLYLRHKPLSASPLDLLGPWPWYIPVTTAAVLGVFALLYTPYLAHDYLKGRPPVSCEAETDEPRDH